MSKRFVPEVSRIFHLKKKKIRQIFFSSVFFKTMKYNVKIIESKKGQKCFFHFFFLLFFMEILQYNKSEELLT